jgi:hypothetical protein
MNAKNTPAEEPAAIDAVFEQAPLTPVDLQAPTGGPGLPTPEQVEETRAGRHDAAELPASPLEDYVRDLGQEFQEQQEEGKL